MSKWLSLSVLVTCALVCVVASVAGSAPMLAGRPPLTDSTKSLRGLNTAFLQVNLLAPQLAEKGLTAEAIAAQWSEAMANAGLEIADEEAPEVASIELTLQSVTGKEAPDAIGILFQLKLHQRVTMERNGLKLKVPTYSLELAGLADDKKLRQSADDGLDAVLERFLAECDAASTARL